jgi:hypothetical protein
MSDVVKMGGTKGNCLVLSLVPNSAFKTILDALVAAGTKVVGKLVTLTFAANYECEDADDTDCPDGEIISYQKYTTASGSSYILSVALWSYLDDAGNRHTPVCVRNLPYSDTIALQDSVMTDGSTYVAVQDGGTDGWGAVIAKDTTNETVDVLF